MSPISFILFCHLFFLAVTQAIAVGNTTAPVTSAAASTTTGNNATIWWGLSYPNYIPLSSTQAGDCDIFGALCQTAPVTVGIDLGSATTTTVVPCSSYLSAQAETAVPSGTAGAYSPAIVWPGPDAGTELPTWLSSFARSPECTSYAQFLEDLNNVTATTSVSLPAPTLSGCPSKITNWEAYIPPGVMAMWGGEYFYCCGYCVLNVPRVRVIYFPDPSAPPCNQAKSTYDNITASASLPTQTARGSTAVYEGYTFTSPSIYLQVLGTANVTDFCGVVGSQYTNAIIPLTSGALSSYSWATPVGGSIFYQPNFLNAPYTNEVQVTDLACPTWGIASTTAPNGDLIVGAPFNPLIAPPPQLTELDPNWEHCSDFEQEGDHLASWAIYDPPHALTPVGALIGPTSVPPAVPETISATPSATPSPVAPPTTRAPVNTQSSVPSLESETVSSSDPGQISVDPGTSATLDPGSTANASPAQSSANPGQSPADPGTSLAESTSADTTPAQSTARSGTSSDGDPGSSSAVNAGQPPTAGSSAAPASDQSIGTAAISQTSSAADVGSHVGSIIYSAFGGASTLIPINPTTSTGIVLTVAGSAITAQPSASAIFVEGTVITPGGPAATVGGTLISIAPSGVLIIGASTVAFPTTAAAAQGSEVPAATDQQFTAVSASAIAIGGTTLTAGGNAAIVSGQVFSVAPSGSVVVVSPGGPSADVFTVGGQAITANPTALIVAGSTLIPGGPAITIAGTPISLAPSGVAIIGSSTVNLNLPTPSVFTVAGQTFTAAAAASAFSIDGHMITAGGSGVTISGTPISLASDGILAIGTSIINLNLPTPSVFTVAGQTFTANPSSFSIDGQTLTAGGSGITISGTPISLASNGILAIGISTIKINSASPTSVFTIAGQTFTADPSSFSIDGHTLTAGGSGITISGTPVSLEAGGTLVIGTSSVGLEGTGGATVETQGVLGFEGGAGRGSEMGRWWFWGGIVGWGVWGWLGGVDGFVSGLEGVFWGV